MRSLDTLWREKLFQWSALGLFVALGFGIGNTPTHSGSNSSLLQKLWQTFDISQTIWQRAPEIYGTAPFQDWVKTVSACPNSPIKHSLLTILGSVLLNAPETGSLSEIVGGTSVSAMRTSAVCGVTTKYLA